MFLKSTRLFRPEVFQGNLKSKRYFEGWYFKSVTADGEKCAIIPGVSLNKIEPHCFVQFIDGSTGETNYITFPITAFEFDAKKFWIRIGDSVFSASGIDLNIDQEGFSAQGKLAFSELSRFPTSAISPGIMGWYTFVPFMECYHGLVSMDHRVSGHLHVNAKSFNFSTGRGYIEKDWGTSFPSSWVWLQSNAFGGSVTSFMFSIAKIPWLGSSFDGFLCVVLVKGDFLKFTTYSGAKITRLNKTGKVVEIGLEDKKYKVNIRVERNHSGVLAAPVLGEMKRAIHESLESVVLLELVNRSNGEITTDTGYHAGCEVVGDEAFQTRVG